MPVNFTIITEAERGDGCGITVELTQSLLVESIPDIDVAIWSSRGKGVVAIVKTGVWK